MARDYKKEYDQYHSKPKQRKERSIRTMDRRKAEQDGRVSKGDGKDLHHTKGVGNRKATVVKDKHANRSFSRKREKGHGKWAKKSR